MSEPDKYRALIGRSLSTHMYELLQILAEENAYTLIVDNGKPELTFHVDAVRRALDHVEQAWSDIHEASAPKAKLIAFRKFSPEQIEQVKS